MKNYKSEEEVKQELGVSDFSSISKEKIKKFVSIIPKVDKEVAIAIINQFPNYVDMAKYMVNEMLELSNQVSQDAKSGRDEAIKSYQIVLLTLRESLQDDTISEEERKNITTRMLETAEKIDAVNDKHNLFVKETILGVVTGTVSGIVAGALTLGVLLLGGKNKK